MLQRQKKGRQIQSRIHQKLILSEEIGNNDSEVVADRVDKLDMTLSFSEHPHEQSGTSSWTL